MNIKYSIDEDRGYPLWRLKFRAESDQIIVSIMNTSVVLYERIDEIRSSIFQKDRIPGTGTYPFLRSFQHEVEVSLITDKGYDYLITRYNEVLEVFYQKNNEVINLIKTNFQREKTIIDRRIEYHNNIMGSDLFLSLKRDKNLKILDI